MAPLLGLAVITAPVQCRISFCQLALLLCVGLGCCDYVQAQSAATLRGSRQEHIIVFDAGSSGTRIHVFNVESLRPEEHVPKIDVKVRDKQTLKLKPGLSHYARHGDLDGAQECIETLLQFADGIVNSGKRHMVPVLLKATAGLRAVSPVQADEVLGRVRETLARSSYHFEDASWADIIKGKEEAGLAWVAANYLEGTFHPMLAGKSSSVGVIEVGGGSTQVSQEVQPGTPLEEHDDFKFKTALGKEYQLYAHSYLRFGQDYAQKALRDSHPVSLDRDPCYPSGYHRTSLNGSMIEGSGDPTGCEAHIVARLLTPSSESPGRYRGEVPLSGRFIGIENFVYALSDLSLPLSTNFDETVAASKTACSTAVTDPDNSPDDPKACFALSYHVALLRALKSPQFGVNVRVTKQISGADVDWALGAALVQYMQQRQKAARDARIVPEFLSGVDQTSYLLLLAVVLSAVFIGRKVFGLHAFRMSNDGAGKCKCCSGSSKMAE
eukprot:TRINITY_DN49631_c0_g1_i1.p1 TRINITY_DN49631_c0_g1~~TRINITY_DN49631_c0_g1_i1.p1  ORF type:complete len:496 (+),score=55.18 TRINITY_DN49631_c0_g1_i1:158-1645(+)